MPLINDEDAYPLDPTPSLSDTFIGTDKDNNNQTRTYSLQSIVTFVAGLITGSTYEIFTATESQTAFVLSENPSNVDVVVDRVSQIPTTDYTLSGNTVTMVNPLSAGSIVVIRKYN